jgi:electron transfer flavoprotein beta subunit
MIGVCLKWVDQRPEFDAFGVAVAPDARFSGVSAADQAALEVALQVRDAWASTSPHEVIAVTVGPADAEGILREALMAGANRAIRVDMPFGTRSRVTAAALAAQLADAALVLCGDYSLDRGTGSVPAFLAAELGFAQALGLVDIDLNSLPAITALRRLDGGRRERLAIDGPTVASVEGSVAKLRRASLRSVLGQHNVETAPGPVNSTVETVPALTRPYRPRPRVLAAPVGTSALDRLRSITAATGSAAHGETVVLDPPAAADRIIATLRDWGYTAH